MVQFNRRKTISLKEYLVKKKGPHTQGRRQHAKVKNVHVILLDESQYGFTKRG